MPQPCCALGSAAGCSCDNSAAAAAEGASRATTEAADTVALARLAGFVGGVGGTLAADLVLSVETSEATGTLSALPLAGRPGCPAGFAGGTRAAVCVVALLLF